MRLAAVDLLQSTPCSGVRPAAWRLCDCVPSKGDQVDLRTSPCQMKLPASLLRRLPLAVSDRLTTCLRQAWKRSKSLG